MHGAQDPFHHRLEQADVDHDAEKQDGEEEHHGRRRERSHAIQHHRSDGTPEATDQCEQDRHDDERREHRHAFGHDQRHEDDDHREGEYGEDLAGHGRGWEQRGASPLPCLFLFR